MRVLIPPHTLTGNAELQKRYRREAQCLENSQSAKSTLKLVHGAKLYKPLCLVDTALDFSFAPRVLTDTMAEQYYSGEN